MAEQYELSTKTLTDIMDKVPMEKWHECIIEMSEALEQIKSTQDAIINLAQAIDPSVELSDVIQFPKTMTWVDDGLKKNTINYDSEDGDSLSFEYNLKGEK